MKAEEALVRYYSERAGEYDDIYTRSDSVRQDELSRIARQLRSVSPGMEVLEIACGTGYWTKILAENSAKVMAFDASGEMLKMASSKRMPGNVKLESGDAFNIKYPANTFDLTVCNFWYSHVPKSKLQPFLASIAKVMKPSGKLFIADNVYQAGIGGELVQKTSDENCYKIRTLSNGKKWCIIKNYPSVEELRQVLSISYQDIQYNSGNCYWFLTATKAISTIK